MLRIGSYEALTYDCYGTLVDWRGGLLAALRTCPSAVNADLDEARFLADREREENRLEGGAYRPYRTVVADSVAKAADRQGILLTPEEAAAVGASIGRWEPFPDVREALGVLGAGRRLGIVSNVERRDITRSIEALGVQFAEVVTAEDVRSYKPGRAHFEKMLRLLDLPRSGVLHVAQSLYHDIRPAAELGIDAVWINRRGETTPDDPTYLASFPDLAGLAAGLGRAG